MYCIGTGIVELATSGAWGEWGKWSPCSVTCGYGSVTRTRNWIFPNGSVLVDFTYHYTVVCDSQAPCPELPKDFDMSKCDLNTFICDSKLQCVSLSERCDDEVHCHDGSDEKDCITYLNMNSKGVPVTQIGAVMTSLTTI
ncbi:hypothetical protein KUTeg_009164 [Tegillarca granosa]|uniref:Uncharacterized protein n=1 Tax=Tegillarca granosa TaxID=220873 RepID=A0ABQ9F7D3_TEGGR|nr:hypothetical protein KUTeg_009164 [Tegillarca granosa]